MHKPTSATLYLCLSWGLLVVTAVAVILAARTAALVHPALLGKEARLPAVTSALLSAHLWPLAVPLFAGIVILLLGRRADLERLVPPAVTGMHLLSVVLLAFALAGTLVPFLSITWSINP